MSHFQEFGCKVQILTQKLNRGKFESRSREGLFIGYSETSKGYRVWLADEKRVEIATNVKFIGINRNPDVEAETNVNPTKLVPMEEPKYIDVELRSEDATTHETGEDPISISDGEDTEVDSNDYEDVMEQTPLIRGRGRPRLIRTGRRGRPRKQFNYTDQTAKHEEAASMAEVPIEEAIRGLDAEEWREAIANEVKSLLKHETWQLVDRPEQGAVIGSRIVLRNKYKEDDTLERRKARVVAKGFAQRPGGRF